MMLWNTVVLIYKILILKNSYKYTLLVYLKFKLKINLFYFLGEIILNFFWVRYALIYNNML